MAAPFCQASRGSPALRQVCSRKVMRSQPRSMGTCGSNRPRRPCQVMRRPWRPTSICSRGKRSSGRENAELNLEMRSFFLSDGREAVVVESGGARGFRHGAEDWAGGQNVADAAAQFFFALIFLVLTLSVLIWTVSAQIERGENTAGFGEVRSGRVQGNLAASQSRRNGIVRQAKQLHALFVREFLNGN